MKCPDCPPVKSLDELVKCTKFSRIELQHMYEGFKNVSCFDLPRKTVIDCLIVVICPCNYAF